MQRQSNVFTGIYLKSNKSNPLDTEATYCIEKAVDDPTSKDEDEQVPGRLEETQSCPQEYYNESKKTPWIINASKSCDIESSQLEKLGIKPTDETCYRFASITGSRFWTICES